MKAGYIYADDISTKFSKLQQTTFCLHCYRSMEIFWALSTWKSSYPWSSILKILSSLWAKGIPNLWLHQHLEYACSVWDSHLKAT